MPETPTTQSPPAAVSLDNENWQLTVLFLLTVINYVMGENGHTQLRKPLDTDDLLTLADQLLKGSYQPREWFLPGTRLTDKNFIKQLPAEPDLTTTFILPTLPGEDFLSGTLNLRSGGVIYEDPFWFLLAAYNINKTAGRFIIPRPASPQKAWQSRIEVLAALHNGQYQADEWFAETRSLSDLYKSHDQTVRFINVVGRDLIRLRTAGCGTLVDLDFGVGWYVMYKYYE